MQTHAAPFRGGCWRACSITLWDCTLWSVSMFLEHVCGFFLNLPFFHFALNFSSFSPVRTIGRPLQRPMRPKRLKPEVRSLVAPLACWPWSFYGRLRRRTVEQTSAFSTSTPPFLSLQTELSVLRATVSSLRLCVDPARQGLPPPLPGSYRRCLAMTCVCVKNGGFLSNFFTGLTCQYSRLRSAQVCGFQARD